MQRRDDDGVEAAAIAALVPLDGVVAETIAGGLSELQHESWFVVTDPYDNGAECLEITRAGAARVSRPEFRNGSRPPRDP
jgi:hypothetical protein